MRVSLGEFVGGEYESASVSASICESVSACVSEYARVCGRVSTRMCECVGSASVSACMVASMSVQVCW